MRIVVTGASGNLGTALLRRLVDEHEVIGVSRRLPEDAAPYSRAQWVTTDLTDSAATGTLISAFSGADAVVHLAWMIQPSRDRTLMRRANQHGTRVVAEAATVAGVPHLVHASSLGAYSPAPGKPMVDESWPRQGVTTSPYSVDKAAAERILDEFEPQLTITRLRPTIILQNDAASEIGRYFLGHLLPHLVHRPLLRFAPWPSRLKLQFVHADDVADAIAVLLANRDRASGGFNVASDPVIDRDTWTALFGGVGPAMSPAVLRGILALSWRTRIQPTDPGWLDLAVTAPLLDTAKLRGLGWSAAYRGDDVLVSFVEALASGDGHPGPLLQPRT